MLQGYQDEYGGGSYTYQQPLIVPEAQNVKDFQSLHGMAMVGGGSGCAGGRHTSPTIPDPEVSVSEMSGRRGLHLRRRVFVPAQFHSR